MGFMFDQEQETLLQHYSFPPYSVSVNVVDDDPGAVISGHYLWPASTLLCSFLTCGSLLPRPPSTLLNLIGSATTALELGAGCAMCGLLVRQMMRPEARMVVTDYDPGVLKRAQGNREETIKNAW